MAKISFILSMVRTINEFDSRTKCMIDQYNEYISDIGMQINGYLTLSENIADNGGLKHAYRVGQTHFKIIIESIHFRSILFYFFCYERLIKVCRS